MKHKNITLLTWHNFFLDFKFYGPIAILYFSQLTGSYALGLGIFSVISIAVAIFELPTGVISDLVGRKESMIFGSLASVLGLLCFALAQGPWFLVLGAILIGISETFFSGNNDALLYDTLKEKNHEKEYAEILGKVSSMFQVGLAAGALIGGFVAGWSFRFVFWISVAPQVVCMILSFFVIEPKKHYEKVSTNVFDHVGKSLKEFGKNWKLRQLSLASILKFGIGETLFQFIPAFFALLWPVWALGIPRFLSHLFGAIGFRVSGMVVKKITPLKAIVMSVLSSRVINIFAFTLPTFISPVLVAITSFFFGVRTVSQNTLMQQEFTHHQRATMGSLNNLFGNIFFALFAFLFGFLADIVGPINALLIGQGLLLIQLVIYWSLFKRMERV